MATRATRTRTRTTPAPDAALARAIEPIAAVTFLAETWEQRPLHVARGEQGRFDDLLSARDAERLVTEPGLRYPAVRLVKAGAKLDPADYTVDVPWRPTAFSGTAEVGRIAREWESGATIVLQGLHLNWTPVAAYCRELEARLGHPVQCNAYWTPRGSQGLPVHHDTHDVFVLQVSGRKRWLVYEPAFELPLKNQRYTPAMGEPGETVLEVELEAGDTLYLPRGWLHEALTSDEDSLHLTVGVNVVSWLAAFRSALDRCADDVEFRRSLPPDGEGAEALVERLARRLGAEEVAAHARRRLVETRRSVLGGQISQLRALDDLALDTRVERRPTVIAELEDGRLSFEGKSLTFPAQAHDELEALVVAEEPVRPADLPGRLDESGRLVLVRRLVREGFLRIVQPDG
jgi:ribosomal protein L16 Arg81 hydroxylase